MIKKITRNPYLLFSPFLVFYGYIVVINKWPTLFGDEIRYIDFAHNLIHGFYSPSAPHINLWSGPGYPILLVPFIAVHVPVLYITLLNAVFQYLAIVFLYKALMLITNHRTAVICGLLLAIYPNALSILPILYTEAFTYLLVSLLLYSITLFYVTKKPAHLIGAGVVLGYLALTKIIFGYVIFGGIVAGLVFILLGRKRGYYRTVLRVAVIALVVTAPYLGYTWWLTGKAFYWGNSGGMSLYWMSTPYENEYGDWKVPDLTNNQYPSLFRSPDVVKILKKNHAKEIGFILKHDEITQDQLFKQRAFDNIKKHPAKFFANYCDNISRMLFNFPYSYAYQDAAIVRNIVIGSLILWSVVAGVIVTRINRSRIIMPVKLVMQLTACYLLLSAAVSSYPRQFDVILPVVLFWLGFVFTNVKKPGLKFTDAPNLDEIDLNDLAEDKIFEKGRIEFISVKSNRP